MTLTSTSVLQALWKRVNTDNPGFLHWGFSDSERELLRVAEKYLRHWAWQHQRSVSIELMSGKEPIRWALPGRYNPTVSLDFPPTLPMVFPTEEGGINPANDAERFIVCAPHKLPPQIYGQLEEMGDDPGVRAIVHWQTQKQVVMNAACNQIPIGDDLQECLNWSRHDYWLRSDLEENDSGFIPRCERELSQDGSNAIVQSYLTYDPVDLQRGGDGDWIRVTGEYRFLDCGRFGLFQLGKNLDFERVSAP